MVEEMTDREKMEFVFGVHEDEPVVVDWDKSVARKLALLEGILLNEEHWEVVSFLRKHFNDVGELDYARDISA
ncbi:TusE/DsrC/DsvC family sulfur relay protein, partial [Kaarinaea lacus]